MNEIRKANILIQGLGAIGGTFAARLIAAGHQPALVAGNPAVAEAINRNGMTVRDGGKETRLEARAVATLDELPPAARFHVAFLCMKANSVVEASRRTAPRLADDGFVVSFQNGVVEPLIAAAIGADKVVGAVLHWAATMHEPGLYEPTITRKIILGELNGRSSSRLGELGEIVKAAAPVEITDNILGALWSKLALNCTVTAIGGLTGLTLSQLLGEPAGRAAFLIAYREVIDAANGHAVQLPQATVDPYAPYLPAGADAAVCAGVDAALSQLERIYGPSKPSILQSLERRKPTEIDFINGTVVEASRRSGAGAPLNEAITRMIHEIEAGARPIGPGNLDELKPLLGP